MGSPAIQLGDDIGLLHAAEDSGANRDYAFGRLAVIAARPLGLARDAENKKRQKKARYCLKR